MFCYHVGSGHSVTCKNVESDTVKGYAKDVAEKLKQINGNTTDIRYADPRDNTMAPILTAVIKDLAKFEKEPNRQEPNTIPMVQQSKKEAKALGPNAFLGLTVAMADWDEVQMYLGARKTEWSQENDSQYDPKNYCRREGLNEARAFTLGDFEFQDAHQRPIELSAALQDPTNVHFILLTFRWQKNNNHGEKKRFARNTQSEEGLCCVSAMMRILKRFVTLFSIHDMSTPVACYLHAQTGKPRLITPKDVNRHLRHLASVVYNLNPKKAKHKAMLQKWTTHSYRIGATVILHELGYDTMSIQFLLRWRSDSFKVYLRATPAISLRHTRELNRALLNIQAGAS